MNKLNSFFGLLLLLIIAQGAHAQSSLVTMSDVSNFFDEIQFKVLLETDVQKAETAGLVSKKCFFSVTNFIDLNVLGKGKTLVVSEEKLSKFLITHANSGATSDELSKTLLAAFKNNEFAPDENDKVSTEKEKLKVSVGGYFVTEFEYHQEPDGVYHPLLEINQTRIYIASDINPSAIKNRVSFLGEWNPIPEEVIHQVDAISFTRDSNLYVLENPHQGASTMHHAESEETIPFERLYVKINNVAGSKINITAGQFRIPFGFWSDYTSHRNFTSTKNNQLVNGFALKKIDLGVKLDMDFNNGFEWQAAIIHGRLARTSGLERADFSDEKDLVSHLGYSNKKFAVGFSAYLADLSIHRIAAGIDYQLNFKKITFSGETVFQQNDRPQQIYDISGGINELSSLSSYLQFDLELTHKLHLYGMYEVWSFMVDSKKLYDPEAKIFHGLRYNINSSLRWTIIEYGNMFHDDYDRGVTHLSTQLDLTF
jgi:hypothetical protein